MKPCKPKNKLLKLLGYSGHKWVYKNIIDRHCTKCGIRYKLIDYDGCIETWQKM